VVSKVLTRLSGGIYNERSLKKFKKKRWQNKTR